MIKPGRIHTIWETSEKIPRPPELLIEIIAVSYRKKKEQELSPNALAYIQIHKEKLLSLLQTPLVNQQFGNLTTRELIKKAGLPVLRNFLIALFLQNVKPAGEYDRIDYSRWHAENWIGAVIARQLANRQPGSDPEHLFALTYLADIALLYLSRTFPEIYDNLMELQAEDRLDARQEAALLGENRGALSAGILEEWGFPAEALEPLRWRFAERTPAGEQGDARTAHLIRLSRQLAQLFLERLSVKQYNQAEIALNEYFKIPPQDLKRFLVEVTPLLQEIGSVLNLRELAGVSLIGLLQANKEFIEKKILPYQVLLDEIEKARRKIQDLEASLRDLRRELAAEKTRDSVTGIYNYTFIYESLKKELSKSARYQYPVSFLLLDVDGFALFNRTYGVVTGDFLLQQLTQLIRKHVRESDIFGRWQQDEFALVLPHTGRPQARFVAEKICRLVSSTEFQDQVQDRKFSVTLSAGFTTMMPTVAYLQTDKMIQQARLALEQAKKAGGNCCFSTEDRA